MFKHRRCKRTEEQNTSKTNRIQIAKWQTYLTLSIITLVVSELNTPVKKQRLSVWLKKARQTYILFLSFFFWGVHTHSIEKFPDQGSNQSYSCWPSPQPQQCQIQDTSATYTTAHGNTRSLAHLSQATYRTCVSCFLVGFINH